MKKHTKLYLSALGFDTCDFVPSELSGGRAVDIHHIECRGQGGDPQGLKDRIENLMALTREEHDYYGDKKQYMFYLYARHFQYLKNRGVKFDENWMLEKLALYQEYAEEYLEEMV